MRPPPVRRPKGNGLSDGLGNTLGHLKRVGDGHNLLRKAATNRTADKGTVKIDGELSGAGTIVRVILRQNPSTKKELTVDCAAPSAALQGTGFRSAGGDLAVDVVAAVVVLGGVAVVRAAPQRQVRGGGWSAHRKGVDMVELELVPRDTPATGATYERTLPTVASPDLVANRHRNVPAAGRRLPRRGLRAGPAPPPLHVP